MIYSRDKRAQRGIEMEDLKSRLNEMNTRLATLLERL